MKFIIKRASIWDEEDSINCKEAKKETLQLTRLDYRTVETLKKAKTMKWYNRWFNHGTNHREENGYIVCDVIEYCIVWTIELNSLEDLMNLQSNYGNIIINTTNYLEIPNELKIYDAYIE